MKKRPAPDPKAEDPPEKDRGESRGPAWRLLAAALLLMAVVVTVYLPASRGGFVWDDPQYVINNTTLRTLDGLGRIWFEPGATPQYYPLVFTTFWVEYHLFELDAAGYHWVNILLHGAGAILVWILLRRLSVPGAFAAAALFAVHPVHVESVAWITERKNVLSLFFYLAAFWAYLRFALPPPLPSPAAEPARRSWGFYALAAAFFLCALFCKTVTGTLPAAVLLVLWWKKKRVTLSDVLPLVPLLAVGAALGCLTVWMEKFHVGASGEEWSLSFLERCLLAGRIPWFYTGKLLWPDNLIFIYPRWEVSAGTWWQYLFPLALVGTVFLLWAARRRLNRGPLVAILFFVGSLFPALGFFNVYPMRFSYVADHFQYLASLGVIALVSATGAALVKKLGSQQGPIGFALLGGTLCLLGNLTWNQSLAYRDLETLWLDTLNKNPGAWIAHSNLGEILGAQGRADEALYHSEEALKLKPDLPEAHGNLANALFQKKRYEEAVSHYREMIRLDPENAQAHNNLGRILEASGKAEEGILSYREAIRREPRYPKAHNNLGKALARQGSLDDAARHFQTAIEQEPDFLDAHYQLGLVLERQGKRVEAARSLSTAMSMALSIGNAGLAREIENRLKRIQ